MTAERRPARTGPKTRKPTGRAPAWALKIGSALFALAVFGGSFDYAARHLATTSAALQPAVVAAVTQATAQPSLTLSASVPTTTRIPVTKTASS